MTSNSKKKILSVIGLTVVVLTWYLFFKKNDYEINFKVKAATGTVYLGIVDWSKDQEHKNNEKYTVIEHKQFNSLVQKMTANNVVLQYDWTIENINDSITKVVVGINNRDHKIWTRLSTPFKSDFISKEIEKIKTFKTGLEEHLANFKIGKVEEGSSPKVFVAYISLESVLAEKAQTMIGSDNIITGYLHNNHIKITGKPLLEVTTLNLEKEKLTFNYCFPIDKNTIYVNDKNVKFKTIAAKKGLKIDYFGNYRTSDRAWFTILDYSKKNNIGLKGLPIEHYQNNPFNGGNEIEWRTEIIYPY